MTLTEQLAKIFVDVLPFLVTGLSTLFFAHQRTITQKKKIDVDATQSILNQYNDLVKKNETLSSRLDVTEKSLYEREIDLVKKQVEFNVQIDTQKTRVQELDRRLTSSEKKSAKDEVEVAQLKLRVKELNEQVLKVTEELGRAKAARDEAVEIAEKRRRDYEALTRDVNTRIEQATELLKQRVQANTQEIEFLKQTNDEKESRVKELEIELSNTKKELSECKERLKIIELVPEKDAKELVDTQKQTLDNTVDTALIE